MNLEIMDSLDKIRYMDLLSIADLIYTGSLGHAQ